MTSSRFALSTLVAALLLFFCLFGMSAFAQLPRAASPSRWLYPAGNSEATHSQNSASRAQNLDSFQLKWSTNAIAGDVQPLIGNIIDNTQLVPSYPFAPLEITAVIAGQLITLDATGRTRTITRLPPFVQAVSVLLDSASLPTELYKRYPSILGLETIERRDTTDSLALGYIAGFDATADTIAILKNLTIDVRPFAPNLFASITPVYAQPFGANQIMVHAVVNMSTPTIPAIPPSLPFFRGMTSFLSGSFDAGALATVSDTSSGRFTVGPTVSLAQPSIHSFSAGTSDCLLPTAPSSLDWTITDSFRPALSTFSNRPYLMSAQMRSTGLSEGIVPVDLFPLTYTAQNSTLPRVRNFHIQLRDAGQSNALQDLVLSSEEYLGRDSSFGTARLHLFNTFGDPITFPGDTSNPSFSAKANHAWSIAIGNVDGLDTNRLLPYYPNNPGDEIVVTQSTHDFAYPGSKLMILRYRSGTRIQKPAPRNAYLFPFDTVMTTTLTGWVACVSDLDSAVDAKDEIFIADGSDLYILHLRDYADPRFTRNAPFDTVYHRRFPTETINHVAVADVDGDGYNDVLVTTNVRCYLFGQPVQNSIQIVSPTTAIPETLTCQGDTVDVRWYNVFSGQPAVKVLFQRYRNGFAWGSAVVLDSSYSNLTDTVTFRLKADSTLAGVSGRIIIQSTQRSVLKDSTGILSFPVASIAFDSSTMATVYRSMQLGKVSGVLRCVDSVSLYCSVDRSASWTLLGGEFRRSSDTTFWIDAVFPCPGFFGCETDADSLISLRAEGIRGDGSVVYSDTVDVRIRPHELQCTVYPQPDVLCSDRGLLWLLPADSSSCDSVQILESTDGGRSFHSLALQARTNNEFHYRPTPTTPDSVILRLCCPGSCLRTDTTVYNTKATVIQKVAPNPFDPTTELCEIFSVPASSSALSVHILDQNEHIITELVRSETRTPGRVYCDRWDGRTDDGKVVAMGMYYVVLQYADGSKEFYPVFVRRN